MAQTRHRTVTVGGSDRQFDEEEHKMQVKEYRKNRINNKPEYFDDLDECPYQEDVEYLLRKNK